MATTIPASDAAAAASEATRVPTLEQAARELRLHGAGDMAQWQLLLGQLAARVRERDQALAARRKLTRRLRIGLIIVAAGAAFYIGWTIKPIAGVILGVVAFLAVIFLIKPPAADYAGTERIDFLRSIVDALAAIAPDGSLRLAAQLHAGRGVPEAKPPSQPGEARGEREDAWLRGSLKGIPGLRLSWQATEWRAVCLRRKVNPRGKTKFKTKFEYASRLVARLDADHALFALNSGEAPRGGSEGVIDARKTARGYTIRGWRERSAKTLLGSMDVPEELAALREGGKHEWFGEPASMLVSLIKHCETRLVMRGAKGGA